MNKKKFLKDGLVLGFTGIILNSLGLVFQVYITRVLGMDGMGLFQLILSVYVLCATFATSGISLSVTRLVTQSLSLDESKGQVRSVMRRCLGFSSFIGIFAGVLLFFISPLIGNIALNNPDTVICFKILAFGLPFMSLSSCLHGFFIGIKKASKSAVTSFIEDIVKVIVVFFVFTVFPPKNTIFGCVVLMVSLILSEVISCFFAFVMYISDKILKSRNKASGVLGGLLKIAVPVATSSYLRSGLTTLENLLIPVGLQKYGLSVSDSLSVFGQMKGLVLPVLFFPASFLGAFTRILIPEITQSFTRGEKSKINSMGSKVIKITLLFSIPITAIFMIFSKELSLLIFSNTKIANTLFLLAPLVPMMYLDGVVDGILKGLDQQVAVMRYNIIEALIRVALVWFVIPVTGFSGFIVTIYAGNVINAALSLNRLVKISDISVSMTGSVLRPALSACAASSGVYVLFVKIIGVGSTFWYITMIFLTSCIYLMLIFALDNTLYKGNIKNRE